MLLCATRATKKKEHTNAQERQQVLIHNSYCVWVFTHKCRAFPTEVETNRDRKRSIMIFICVRANTWLYTMRHVG